MKELSIEEKAKRYDEAIEKARKIHNEQKAQSFNVMLKIFPELKESENERIRKELIEFVKNSCFVRTKDSKYNREQMLAWIEKQGEQKPIEPTDLKTWKYIVDAVLTEREGIGQYIDSPWTTDVAKKLQKRFGNIEQKPAWSEEDNIILSRIIADYERSNEEWFNAQNSLPHGKKINWLKSLKDKCLPQPKQKWSEEDETIAKALTKAANDNVLYGYIGKSKLLDWIKSIKDRYTWKPSDEQMRILSLCNVSGLMLQQKDILVLKSLYEDLKALLL